MNPHPKFLDLDEISPSVDLSSCFRTGGHVWNRYRLPGHHLILIEQGMIAAKTPVESFEARAGDLICFRPSDANSYATKGDTIFYQAHTLFAPPPRHDLTPWLEDIGPLPVKTKLGDAHDEARRAFETVCLEITQPGPQHALRIKAAILSLLAIIAAASKRQPKQMRHLDPLQRVRMRMETNLDHDLRVSELAANIGVTVEHFIRIFKERFGTSPRAYHTQLRLREAARLLRDGERSVKSVSYMLGFPDPRAFARLLRRHTGMKPSDLRVSPTPSAAIDDVSESQDRLIPMNQHLGPPAPVASRSRQRTPSDVLTAWERKWDTLPTRGK